MKSRLGRLMAWSACLLVAAQAYAINVTFDYSYDTNDFFGTHPGSVVALSAAAEVFAAFTDDLAAIQPSGPDKWTAYFFDPATGETETMRNLVVPADTLIVFVGGRDLPGNAIGEGGPGGYSARGFGDWVDTVAYRGETGAAEPSPTDFGPWGGSIAFDTDTDWHLGVETDPSWGQVDFLSVATHEIAHVLGFGIADSWKTHVTGSEFTGPVSTTVFGSSVPLSAEAAHWASGTMSTADGSSQEAAMSPAITLGTRKLFTILDYAGMADVGWEYPPRGDANADGVADGADYTIWADNYFATPVPPASQGGWVHGNFNEDDTVDGADYTLWADAYGLGGGAASSFTAMPAGDLDAPLAVDSAVAPAAVVPEPAAIAALCVGALLALRRRRR
jgi:hypothetical protein